VIVSGIGVSLRVVTEPAERDAWKFAKAEVRAEEVYSFLGTHEKP
jgi:hypothetical protein